MGASPSVGTSNFQERGSQMKQLKHVAVLIAIAIFSVVSVGTVAVHSAGADTVTDEAAFLSKLNALRASKGLAALQVNAQLVSVARGWSGHMAAAGAISHNPNLASQAPSSWT